MASSEPPTVALGVDRDAAVDLVKAACLVIVVGLHAMMAGVTLDEDGLAITNALEGHPIFAWATWGLQVMPLFFLLGGFSSLTQWRRMRAEGATASDYIRQRVDRLAHPALLPITLIVGSLAAIALTGVSSEVLGQVGYRIGQPLWFLAVYLGCSGFIPLMARLHDAAPRTTLLSLLVGAILVDTAAVSLRLPAIGILNLVFVWLFIQQVGFWYSDGWFLRLRRWILFAMFVAAFGVLVFLTLVVGYSTDMYVNLNPPTICILVLGVAQVSLFSWAHPYLDRVAAIPVLARAANSINRNSMTIYLWHVPVVVIVALTMMSARLPFPEPLSRDWWETRPLFLAAIALGLVPVILLVAYYDRTRRRQVVTPTSPLLAVVKVIAAVGGVVVILVVGFSPFPSAAIGIALIFVAVRLRSLRARPETRAG